MAKFPTSRTLPDYEAIVRSMDGQLVEMLTNLQEWRAQINTNSSTGGSIAQANYSRMVSTRAMLVASIAINPNAIGAAYAARFGSLPGFDPAADWATAKATLDAFITWFIANWPQRSASGNPAFVGFDGQGRLVDISIPLTGATKTLVLSQIDAVLDAFS